MALFRVIYSGLSHDRLRLPAYGGRLFDPDRFAFLEGRSVGESWTETASRPLPVDDLTVRAILEAIQTLPIRESGSRERRRLSFRSLDVEQIGHVYEGLLDHGAVRVDDLYVGLVGKTGDEAEIPLVDLEEAAQRGPQPLVSFLHDFTGKSEGAVEKLIDRGQAVARGEDSEARRLVNTVCDNDAALATRVSPFVYTLRTDLHGLPVVFRPKSLVVKQTRARRDSGTEYTPREIAEEMVRYALEPLVYSPGPRDGAELAQWRLRTSRELIDLKICDPAVGSGAFLVSACRYLADRIVEAWISEDIERAKIDSEDLTREARRAVVDRCLYGVDRDPMAVEMAKLSLWLITMARDRPFNFLDHSLRAGDSLLGITSLEQTKYVHIDPAKGKAVHFQSLFDVANVVQPLIDEAAGLRRQLEAIPSLSNRDSEEKKRLNDQANVLLGLGIVVADAVIGTTLVNANKTNEKQQKSASMELGLRVRAALTEPRSKNHDDLLAALSSSSHQMLNAGRPENGPARATMHWPLAFPEVFSYPRNGFDVIVGNPPFVGGKKISGSFGSDYREYLVLALAEGRKGNADLVSYFFLRAAMLSRSFAFLAVNTIAQGDTREVGLDAIVQAGWKIVRAIKSRRWPGTAGVHIAQVWLSNESGDQKPFLDGRSVSHISPLLVEKSRAAGNPYRLATNAGIAFIGSNLYGIGFCISELQAAELIARSPKNRDVLFPFLNGDDVCSRADASPSRWVINFFDWPLERAEQYPECLEIVRLKVKPERDKNKAKGWRESWWLYASRLPELYIEAAKLERVIVMPLTSKAVMPLMVSSGVVFQHTLGIFLRNDFGTLGLLSSGVHRAWVRKYVSTLETRTRYVPKDCFETFALPEHKAEIAKLMESLSKLRRAIMIDRASGLTNFYNMINKSAEVSSDLQRVRELHALLDQAIVDAYGWNDVIVDYGFRETDEGMRWAMSEDSQNEILDRLLELNHKRHAQEGELENCANAESNRNGKRGRTAKISRSISIPFSPMSDDGYEAILEN